MIFEVLDRRSEICFCGCVPRFEILEPVCLRHGLPYPFMVVCTGWSMAFFERRFGVAGRRATKRLGGSLFASGALSVAHPVSITAAVVVSPVVRFHCFGY